MIRQNRYFLLKKINKDITKLDNTVVAANTLANAFSNLCNSFDGVGNILTNTAKQLILDKNKN